MSFRIEGRVWKYGDNVNTDVILPGKYLVITDPVELGRHAMEGVDRDFSRKVRRGDVIVGGRNFGCGSSREHAPLALKAVGVGAVVAESLARIFYRNAINLGLPALECRGVSGLVQEGDLIVVDVLRGEVRNPRTGRSLRITPLPEFIVSILRAGGLIPYLREHIDEW
ncbi:3-isopropylmalate dehydratase small subunit [Candidatus Bathyarchaeota archaeon]|nr:MAG: 3-isopropylmalate dehydratase small subunit [Candidatus Bathyarchaeota archaeon]